MSIRFEYALEVNKPPEEAFALLDDLPRTPEWLGPCTAIEKLSTSENKVGDKLKYHYREGGRAGEMEGEITARTPPERLACRYFDKMFEVVVDFRVSKTDSGAKLHHVIEMTPKSFLAKLVSPMVRKQLPKQTIDAMESIKKILAQ